MPRLIAITLLCIAAAAPLHAAYQQEHIVVSGGPSLYQWEKFKNPPHDRWWGNFIRPAVTRFQEIKAADPNARMTWLVYRPAYERRLRQNEGPLTSWISQTAAKYGARLIWFNSTDTLVNYLNAGQPRDSVKIGSFDIFVHSNKACFMFDYSNQIDSGSKAWLHEDELGQIHRGIFAKKAHVQSWGCHSGESMSKKWRRATGVPMIGAIGKTDYSVMYRNNWLPGLSGGRWAR
ncbi:MAG: hypothetical protein RIQ71_1743 [Verrucomicrobiota bacterium]|jgi:hypothetical protein